MTLHDIFKFSYPADTHTYNIIDFYRVLYIIFVDFLYKIIFNFELILIYYHRCWLYVCILVMNDVKL